jgi:nitroreductase
VLKSILNNFLIFSALVLLSTDDAISNQPDYGDSSLLSEIFIKRHSGKNFEVMELTEEQYEALIQSARWTPSSYNDQPWNFIFCDRYKNPQAYGKVINSIYGQDWVENVQLFVITIVRHNFDYNQEENEWALYDTGAAALSMSLQASEMGLMAHQIGGFDRDEIKQEFNLPDGFEPITIIAIGYEKTAIDSSEEEPRTRYPKEKNFFSGEWGQQFNSKEV